MFDHIKFGVRDFARSRAFYLAALEAIGVTVVTDWPPDGVELSQPTGTSSLCLYQAEQPHAPLHLAFEAEHRQQVDAFYRAALAAGGQDNGPPGLRPQYSGRYYAAFVLDPDGHNVEVVCHEPEPRGQAAALSAMKIDLIQTTSILLGAALAVGWMRWTRGLGMKRLSVLVIALALGGAPYLAHRQLRLGRDVLFHGSSPSSFTLPNGVEVSVGRWYFKDQLLGEDQDFVRVSSPDSPVGDYLAIHGDPSGGLARYTDGDGLSRNLLILYRQDHATRGDRLKVGGGLPVEPGAEPAPTDLLDPGSPR